MSREAVSGIWKILKYYEPVLLPNTTCRSCYYLFIIEATGLKNGWTCALKLWGSSLHSIFMVDDE